MIHFLIAGPVFELKLNITDSDFIIVVEPSLLDSSAVILRSTTVIAYRPDMVERPFSCNLNNAEVFSCFLGNEDGSALSIIDPVTINFEIAGRSVPGMHNVTRITTIVEILKNFYPKFIIIKIQLIVFFA